jgi:hypothetical protein
MIVALIIRDGLSFSPFRPEMTREHQWRHANPVRANVKSMTKQLTRFLSPSIPCTKSAGVKDVTDPSRTSQRCINRRLVNMMAQAQRARQVRTQPVPTRALAQIAPKAFGYAKFPDQAINIPQVAHATSKIPIREKMCDTVHHHIGRREN